MRRAALVLVMASTAFAQGKNQQRDLAAEVTRLQQEVAQQRQVLQYLLQDQQQQSSMLLQLLGATPKGGAPMSYADSPPDGTASPSTGAGPAKTADTTPRPGRGAPAGPTTFSLSGKVLDSVGAPVANGFVYISDVSSLAKGQTFSIKQQNKTFVPAVAAIQRGTQVSFPNTDSVFHDVFSRSPGNAFDVGAIQAGEKTKSVTLVKAGVVEIFCNFHAKMNAQILVVPGPLFAPTDVQGHFKIDGVPAGRHTVVGWAASSTPSSTAVDVNAETAPIELTVASDGSVKSHLNKNGQAYGSYGD